VTDLTPPVLLGRAFASRAEQLREQVFDLFCEPSYFPELLDPKSCVLVGGRGSGKTTVLRGMSYQGRLQLTAAPPHEWDYYGLYLRINTARVTAFRGPDLSADDWSALFGHYLNILLVEAVVHFLGWYERRIGLATVTAAHCQEVARGFGVTLEEDERVDALLAIVKSARSDLELYANNIVDGHRPTISVLGAPLDALMESVIECEPFDRRPVFFLIDEYENLSPEQQRVANTLVKHAGTLYVFKIGVKELGWRSRQTLNADEQLQAPADYAQIDISERLGRPGVFASFASQICNERLQFMASELDSDCVGVEQLLPPLSEDAEADLLGVAEHVAVIRAAISASDPDVALSDFDALPPLYQYLVGFWAEGHPGDAASQYRDLLANPKRWDTRYVNYKHSLLYTLRAGKRGIRKYYAGFDTYLQIAGGNLRFLLQLVEQALRGQLASPTTSDHSWLTTPSTVRDQTAAAQAVAQRNLAELEGLSLIGPRLTRLVVGLGRLFQLMASDPAGHTPEVTQFRLSDEQRQWDSHHDLPDPRGFLLEDAADVYGLLSEAITHLAIRRLPGTKLSGTLTRQDDYMVYPIFVPIFGYSYRLKRKMKLSDNELLGLVASPAQTVQEILERSGRGPEMIQQELPDQMYLFDAYLRAK
jgi:hypothetical protein